MPVAFISYLAHGMIQTQAPYPALSVYRGTGGNLYVATPGPRWRFRFRLLLTRGRRQFLEAQRTTAVSVVASDPELQRL